MSEALTNSSCQSVFVMWRHLHFSALSEYTYRQGSSCKLSGKLFAYSCTDSHIKNYPWLGLLEWNNVHFEGRTSHVERVAFQKDASKNLMLETLVVILPLENTITVQVSCEQELSPTLSYYSGSAYMF